MKKLYIAAIYFIIAIRFTKLNAKAASILKPFYLSIPILKAMQKMKKILSKKLSLSPHEINTKFLHYSTYRPW